MPSDSCRFLVCLVFSVLVGTAHAASVPARRSPRAAQPVAQTGVNSDAYRSAIVIDAATDRVLFEDHADVQNPPASVVKLMTFYVIHEKIQRGEFTLQTPVTIAAEAAQMGGSEAWLVHRETVPVEELLYLLMVQSANDAAMALAIYATGSREVFVELMNLKARELGMTHTVFTSPHGLPPGKGQEPDVSTARDLALLSRVLLAKTDILRYTSPRRHEFRHGNGVVNQFRNHNHLLALVPGCDGLKTGWYAKAGYSLAATVQRHGRRIITVILGSQERKQRDTVTTRLIERGFVALPSAAAPVPTAASTVMSPATNGSSAPPVAATVDRSITPAVTQPAATASTHTGDQSPLLQLVPLTSAEQRQSLISKPPPSTTVHVDLSGAKK